MTTILIVSYFFPPCNIVAAQRIKSFADNFKKFGLYPVIVTRHWTGEENSTAGYESENLDPPTVTDFDTYTLIELPYAARLARFYHYPFLTFRPGNLLLYTFLYAF